MDRLVAATLLSVVMLSPAFGLAADVPAWQIAQLGEEALSGWDQPAREQDHSFRSARAGRTATLAVPVWWGEGFRPAEGRVYDLHITYKDTATEPVIFSAHAGIERNWGLSEIHRFGGYGDGQWKEAIVPISWDLVCRRVVPFEGPQDTTVLAIRANKDLPVEKIELKPAAKDAAERYARESREWVARIQADKRKQARLGRRQEPVIPEAMQDQALIPFARSYLVILNQTDAPQKGEAGAALELRMARNEYEPATFGVYANGRDLKNVRFTVGDLVSDGGDKLAADLITQTAEYAVVGTGPENYRMAPQRLWPMYPVDIPAGRSHWFWIHVKTLGDRTRPGTYTGTVDIRADGAKAQLPITVEVLPVTLLTMQEAGLECGTCTTGVPPAQDLKALVENNHTGIDLWVFGTHPQMRVEDGRLGLDFTYLDDWMKWAAKYGMTHMMWFLGGDPYGFPNTLSLERTLYAAQAGRGSDATREFIEKANENPRKVLPEIRDLYVDWVRQVAANGQKAGWPGKLILHPFDEPAKWVQSTAWEDQGFKVIGAGEWIRDHFKDGCALIRQGGQGYDNILVGGDMHHAQPSMVFLEDVDVFCTNAIHEDLALGDKVRDAGVQFWQYSGGNTNTPPHQGRFTYGFYFAAFGSRGTLTWAYNWMDRFDTARPNQWGYGWYTPFGNVPSSWMYGKREGFDDRRWIETYRKAVGDEQAARLLEPIYRQAVEQRNRRGRDTVSDFYAEMERHEQLNTWRGAIMDALLQHAQAR